MDNPTIGKLLKAAMTQQGMSENELARRSGVPQSTINRILSGQSRDPRQSNLAKLERVLGVNLSGGMRYQLTPMADWDDGTPLDSDDVEVPLYKEVELAAGEGSAHHVEINGRKLRFSRATLRAAGVDVANAACATVSGNSMERVIFDGSTIGIDRGQTIIKDGKIYAIDHDGMLRVKYLYRVPGGLRLRSENSEEHPDETYTGEAAAAIRVLGRVFWVSTLLF